MACMEMLRDIVDEREIERQTLARVVKACGHACYPSSVDKCCQCSDLRPVIPDGTYPTYEDGVGWTNSGFRKDGYCPVCCPNNLVRWQRERRREADRVAERNARLAAERDRAGEALAEDRVRAARSASANAAFEYQNGDVYEGEWQDGLRHGFGRMTYAEDGATYEGGWEHGLESGRGTKRYLDGIEYVGEFERGMMHGRGRFTMADGVVLDGAFLEDEWQGDDA